ncbi:MAG: hypothetical protein CMD39_07285 [Gammaproteobacteria bacterium]|nr:hypothetical protein [Gammaproteobacteria bacterium]
MTPARPEPGERLVVEQRVHRRATLDDHWRPVPERTDVFRAVLTVRFAYRNGRIVGRLPDGRELRFHANGSLDDWDQFAGRVFIRRVRSRGSVRWMRADGEDARRVEA